MAETDLQRIIANKFGLDKRLLSPEPGVELLGYTQVPQQEGLSEVDRRTISSPRIFAGESARTCYSSDLCRPIDYLKPKHKDVTDSVVESTRRSGHLTTRQQVEFVFGLTGVSRQLIWAFLHPHPFYNSDQQSQRYVTMKRGNYLIPQLDGEALAIYESTIDRQMEAYEKISECLKGPVRAEIISVFPYRERHMDSKYKGDVQKKAQEVARYVLPIATHANLYHSISALTLMRYARVCAMSDVPTEAKITVAKMVEAVVREVGTDYLDEIPDPIALAETPEFSMLNSLRGEVDFAKAREFIAEFNESLDGRVSKLLDTSSEKEHFLSDAVRGVLGLSRARLTDVQAIEMVLNPQINKTLGETLNVTTMSPLSRALEAVSLNFKKKISHTGDSQDQRHRMTPASRTGLVMHYTGEPDFITPALIKADPQTKAAFQDIMEQSFVAVNNLLGLGVPFEKAAYLLPNAVSIRFTENGSLLNWHHKYRMRLCFTAQEEIWNASRAEVEQITQYYPEIGQWLLPPCSVRDFASLKPICAEGSRYCGVPVWKLKRDQYKRLI